MSLNKVAERHMILKRVLTGRTPVASKKAKTKSSLGNKEFGNSIRVRQIVGEHISLHITVNIFRKKLLSIASG
jgi:hypothetical protein